MARAQRYTNPAPPVLTSAMPFVPLCRDAVQIRVGFCQDSFRLRPVLAPSFSFPKRCAGLVASCAVDCYSDYSCLTRTRIEHVGGLADRNPRGLN